MSGIAEVAFPERLGLDVLVADGAEQLAGVRVSGVRMFNSAGRALLPEEGANVGHCVF